MSTKQINGSWLTQTGWIQARCDFNSTIVALTPNTSITKDLPTFIPAPVDCHIHGSGGYDCMHNEQALRGMLKAALKNGTGALLATSVTATIDDTTEFLHSVAKVMQSPDKDAALLLGAHLEGPFISPNMLGAQPPFATAPNLQALQTWLDTGVVKVMTYAPEVDPNGQLLSLLHKHSVRAQLGHTNCTWHQAQAALNQGCGVTHLYNAMTKVAHRDGGAATAALAYADFAEIITDGVHVERPAFDAAHRAIPNLYSVTDATAAAGMPDGEFMLGTLQVHKKGNKVCLPDGTLAGSCLTQLQSIAVLRDWGLAWPAIVELTSARPARWINEPSLGTVELGARANWLELQDEKIQAIWLEGIRYSVSA